MLTAISGTVCEPMSKPSGAWTFASASAGTPFANKSSKISLILRLLLREYDRRGDASILVPVHGGRRGHPVALAWHHVAGIRRHPADEGLNTYLRQHAAATREIAVPSAEILRDLDTPEDYERLLRGE